MTGVGYLLLSCRHRLVLSRDHFLPLVLSLGIGGGSLGSAQLLLRGLIILARLQPRRILDIVCAGAVLRLQRLKVCVLHRTMFENLCHENKARLHRIGFIELPQSL